MEDKNAFAIKRVDNPPNRFHQSDVEWLDEPPAARLEIFEEQAKSIVSTNNSPDISFRHSVNPYRGCFHGCAYCYARPSHQYLDFGAGSDFERKIVVKVNAAELLRQTFMRKSWQGEQIIFSGNTDCYQPLESHYRLTRRCLEVCAQFRNPVAMITKGALVRRDLDLLQELHRCASIHVTISLAFANDSVSRKIEPGAPRPSIRFRALEQLSKAGIPTGVGVAPLISGLNEDQIPEILQRASDCGAKSAFMTLLRLPAEVKPVFIERLKEEFPTRADRVLHQLQEMRQGALYRSNFGARMRGEGPRWDAIRWMFDQCCERYALNSSSTSRFTEVAPHTFKRPQRQLGLFE